MIKNILSNYGQTDTETLAQIAFDALCKDKGLALPECFAQFYRENNGIVIQNDDLEFVWDFPAPFWQRKDLTFQGLYSAQDILFAYKEREGNSFPRGTIPFVMIELCEICLSVRADSFGQIFFCEKDPVALQMTDSATEVALAKFNPGDGRLPDIICKMAGSFEAFVSHVRVQEWDAD